MLALSIISPAFAAHHPIHKLHTMVSQPGQSKVSFLVDVAHWMRTWSDKTGYEACGEIAQTAKGWAVVVTTSRSHIGCAVNLIPSNTTDTGETIHSHGINKRVRVSRGDVAFLPSSYRTLHIRTVVGQNTEHFSPADYRGGAGYLAGHHGLYYQRGEGTYRVIKSW